MEHPPFDSPLLPLKRTPLALDQRPRVLRIVHTHTGLTKLRYFLFFLRECGTNQPQRAAKLGWEEEGRAW